MARKRKGHILDILLESQFEQDMKRIRTKRKKKGSLL